jgi:multimeric flavodoxin WrbA
VKVVGFLGTPSTTELSSKIATRFLETAQSLSAQVQIFELHKLNYSRCQVCMGCKVVGHCVLQDDLTEILETVRDADVLVLASPLRSGDVTYRLKALIERINCFIEPDYLTNPHPSRLKPGKKLVFILTQEQADESVVADTYSRYEYFLRWCGFHDNHLIQLCGKDAMGDLQSRMHIMKMAEETARQIVQG